MAAQLKECSTDELIKELRSRAIANESKRSGNGSPLNMPVDALISVLETLFNVFFDWYIKTIRRLVIWFVSFLKWIVSLFNRPF